MAKRNKKNKIKRTDPATSDSSRSTDQTASPPTGQVEAALSQATDNMTDLKLNDKTPTSDSQAAKADALINDKSFLGLYPELRNKIYQLLINSGPAALLKRRKAGNKNGNKICIKSPMIVINKQISAEYLSLARATAPKITTYVHDLSFNRVIAFLANLEVEVPSRDIHIVLSVSKGDESRNTQTVSFYKWLCTLAYLRPIEAKVKFHYHWNLKLLGEHSHENFFEGRENALHVLLEHIPRDMKEGRKRMMQEAVSMGLATLIAQATSKTS